MTSCFREHYLSNFKECSISGSLLDSQSSHEGTTPGATNYATGNSPRVRHPGITIRADTFPNIFRISPGGRLGGGFRFARRPAVWIGFAAGESQNPDAQRCRSTYNITSASQEVSPGNLFPFFTPFFRHNYTSVNQ